MKTGILNYGMGNITSVYNALQKLGIPCDVIYEPKEIKYYDTIILPGVGAFKQAMKNLVEKGLDIALLKHVDSGNKLVGICLGMQLLFSKSYEFGETYGLGLIDGEVLPFDDKIDLSIPHMGWNSVKSSKDEFKEYERDFYFVHSYYCLPKDEDDILFKTDYGIEFCSAVMKSNTIIGFQFHPEKSQYAGLSLLKKVLLDNA